MVYLYRGEEMIIFKNGDWLIRHVEESDQHLLVKWLRDPRVLEYYEGRDKPYDLEAVNLEFINVKDHIERCIIEYHSETIGYIQIYPLDADTQKIYGISGNDFYGMDQFIGEPSYWNKGIGTELVSLIADYLISVRKAEQVYMDPQLRNPRALRCYEKAGFKKVKLLPEHEWHEGKFQDCWLMVYPGQ